MEEVTKECRKGGPWELLYADDLVLTAEAKEEVIEMFKRWRKMNAEARIRDQHEKKAKEKL